MVGSLDLTDLEQCFFALDYLPLLKERKISRKILNLKNSSNAAQLQQEEAFLEAFWHLINPR
jgi:hypothetical protein